MSGHPRIDVLGFSHIGFVVPSIREYQETWGRLMGITDWVVRDVPQLACRVQVDGELVDQPSANRVAFAKFSGTSIELIEPLNGTTSAGRWLQEHGGGMQHIGVWVADLPTEIAKLGDAVRIAYSPASLIPELADRAGAALVAAEAAGEIIRPPFWSYVEPPRSGTTWHLELLDAKFESAYREYYGDYAFYPGELPDTTTLDVRRSAEEGGHT